MVESAEDPPWKDEEVETSHLLSSSSRTNEHNYGMIVAEEQRAEEIKKDWKSKWLDFWFPPNTPLSCQLWRLENIGLPLNYLVVGLLMGFSSPIFTTYPLDLGATEAQQVSFAAVATIPSSFKIIFGFLSDVQPLFGYRRKSYQAVGWMVSSAALLVILLQGDNLNLDDTSDDASSTAAPLPSMTMLSLWMLIQGMGMWFSDVMADTMIVEKTKFEPQALQGQIQSTCYAFRFFGTMVGQPLAIFLYSSEVAGPRCIFIIMAILPLVVMTPAIVVLLEKTEGIHNIASVAAQCREIYSTVCQRSVWQPMAFCYIFNVLQIPNGAWLQFLRTNLHFSSEQINWLNFIANALLYISVVCYQLFMMSWSWRRIYFWTTMIVGFFSLLQILLIEDMTFGLSPFLFTLGDNAIAQFVYGLQFLPLVIIMAHLCPKGSEGASYAMFTTVNNSALIVNQAISTELLGIWDVSEPTLAADQLNGLLKLTILTSTLQLSGILFIPLLPHYKEDLLELKTLRQGSSHVGGILFLLIVLGSMFYAIAIGVLNIVDPGWSL